MTKTASPMTQMRESWWTIRRLLWTGATSLAIFAVCTFFVMREKPAPDQSQYLTADPERAGSIRSMNPDATVSIFETKEDRVTVLWVDGLKSLPARIRREITHAPPRFVLFVLRSLRR